MSDVVLFGNGVDGLDLRCVTHARRLAFLGEDLFGDVLNEALCLPDNERLAESLVDGRVVLEPDNPQFVVDLASVVRSAWVPDSDVSLNELLAVLIPVFAVSSPVGGFPSLEFVFSGSGFEVYRLAGQVLVVTVSEFRSSQVFELGSCSESLLEAVERQLEFVEGAWSGESFDEIVSRYKG